MKLSFIVSAFNRPDALRTCLSSLVQQTMPDWEAVVVDNSDRTLVSNLEVCKIDERITYLCTGDSTQIEGAMHKYCVYTASEMGVRKTTGTWLCFPSDDSYYCPWFAERMLAHAERHALQLVYCNIVMGGPHEHHPMICSPRLCCIDKTNWLVKRSAWQGWVGAEGASYAQADGLTIEHMVRRGVRMGRLDQMLVVHN